MFIKELRVDNFRGIEKLIIPLDKNGVVFYGINGSGKTSMLKSINILFSRLTDRIAQGKFKNGISFEEEDISDGYSDAKVAARVMIGQKEYTISRTKSRMERTATSAEKSLNELARYIRTELAENNEAELPVYVVYGVNRSVINVPLRIKEKHSFDRIDAYEKSSAGTDFRVFFEWFRNQEDYENQVRAKRDEIYREDNFPDVDCEDASYGDADYGDASYGDAEYKTANSKDKNYGNADCKDANYEDHQLKAVRKAIYCFMPDLSNLMVERRPKLRMVVTKNKVKLSINQLSDAEKCYLAMIGDLARRMAIANPQAEDALSCSGIVLIDEIELHLHPEWQRKIVPALRCTFPNIQFIITTHSPQVLGEVKDMSIYKLYKEKGTVKCQRVSSAFGRGSDFILEEFMDTPERNIEVTYRISHLYKLISAKAFDEAIRLIEELSNEVGNDDADVVKARILVARGKAKTKGEGK